MSRFYSYRHADLTPYTPGEQPKILNVTKLNTNECPFPPSAKAKAFAAANTRELNLYPELLCIDLREKLAELYGVGADNILLGNGSDELLNFAFLAFGDTADPLVFPDVTYGFYPVLAALDQVPYEEIPVREDTADFEAAYEKANAADQPADQLNGYLAACELYGGDFLPMRAESLWATQEDRKSVV